MPSPISAISAPHQWGAATSTQTNISPQDRPTPVVISDAESHNQKPRAYYPVESMENLNGKAQFPPEYLVAGQQVACRHLSLWYAMERNRQYREGKPAVGGSFVKTLQEKLGTTQDISKNISPQLEPLYNAILKKNRENTLVAAEDWSHFLAAQFSKMKIGENRQLFVVTTNHAMTLNLRVKKSVPADKTVYVATFYEPNITANHVRYTATSLDEIKEQAKLDIFLNDAQQKLFEAGLMSCMRLPDNTQQLLASNREIEETLGPRQLEHTQNVSPQKMAEENMRFGKRLPQLFQMAARDGFTDLIKEMLIDGFGIDEKDRYGRTALIWAAESGHVDTIVALLKAGASVNQADKKGWTALMFAARYGHTDALEKLLAADRIEVNHADQDGCTALMFAAYYGHTDAVEKLLAAEGIAVNQAQKDDATALMMAAQNGHADAVEKLLAAEGIEVNQASKFGKTALMLAADEGHADAVEKLLAAEGIEVNQAAQDSWTALMMAAYKGHTDAVEKLLAAEGILPRLRDDFGFTARRLARINNHQAVVNLLNPFYNSPPGKFGLGRLVAAFHFIKQAISK